MYYGGREKKKMGRRRRKSFRFRRNLPRIHASSAVAFLLPKGYIVLHYHRHKTMSGPREGPNPLRPYYVPPSTGPIQKGSTSAASTHAYGSRSIAPSATLKSGLGTSARDIFSDLDYSDYLSDASPSIVEVAKSLADQATWKYVSVLLGQPFEVAKTILQVHVPSAGKIAPLRTRGVEELQRDDGSEREDPYDVGSSQELICVIANL